MQRAESGQSPFFEGIDLSDPRAVIGAIVARYPRLTHDQIQIAYAFNAQGKGVLELTKDRSFLPELDLADRSEEGERRIKEAETFRALLGNAVSDSVSIVDLVVNCNLRLVAKFAKLSRIDELEDRFQAGAMGLMSAAKKYDLNHGNAFSTYAVISIQSAIRDREKRKYQQIGISTSSAETVIAANAIRGRLLGELGRDPSREEIERELSNRQDSRLMISEALDIILGELYQVASIDAEVGKSHELYGFFSLAELLPNQNSQEYDTEGNFIRDEAHRELKVLLARSLPEPELRVIVVRFGIGLDRPRDLGQSAEVLGTTIEKVRQLESKAMRRLRSNQDAFAVLFR